jgi:class 3 adenylate cyclase
METVDIRLHSHVTAMTLLISSDEWPFVTLNNTFEQTGQNVLDLSGAERFLIANFVTNDQRDQWEIYSPKNQAWVQNGIVFRGGDEQAQPIAPYIHLGTGDPPEPVPDGADGAAGITYAPVWQIAPAPVDPLQVNYNVYLDPVFSQSLDQMLKKQTSVLSDFVTPSSPLLVGVTDEDDDEPRASMVHPIRQGRTTDYESKDSPIVAAAINLFTWNVFFENILHSEDTPGGMILVISNTCGLVYTYSIDGPVVTFLGVGDLHDESYNSFGVPQPLRSPSKEGGDERVDPCPYLATLYPSDTFRVSFTSNDPRVLTAGAVSVFGLSIFCFLLYGSCVERRQKDQMKSALRVSAVIGSIFPKQVLKRLLEHHGGEGGNNIPLGVTVSAAIEVNNANESSQAPPNLPIADLFPHCTVMYGDMVGFTAWSSAREPTQVFTLLENVYYSFDMLAAKRRVFKVETIGDCYVAVVGLPDPRKNHATIMARFADDCIHKLREVVQGLEIELGPETADLSMRFGLNSGPVIAGVLRGGKSRFQLFGDTVATAAAMEHTGATNRIHISQQTADILHKSGKGKWVKPRENLVYFDGKGKSQTYWLSITSESICSEPSSFASSDHSSTSGDSFGDFDNFSNHMPLGRMVDIETAGEMSDKTRRLVDWMVEMLSRSLKKIVAMREDDILPELAAVDLFGMEGTVLDEVKEIIPLPGQAVPYKRDPESIRLDENVKDQLHDYVCKIATMYRDMPFHNFEHAGHVTMSVGKLVSRIVSAKEIDYNEMSYKDEENHHVLHKNSYGITSDPLTQFTMSFCALIHDVDHTGVPNSALVKEKASLAELYNNKSVAEQNSVDLAWDLFMEPQYNELRGCICPSEADYQRFRQLVVNTVMATDIVDKELGALRKQRWNVAFDDSTKDENPLDTVNRKATIVIEHLIQASDVAHTMQHWHVYRQWNERFFQECYKAYKEGRAERDPSIGWYKGEIGFFDFYVIPLAKKLKDCGVFGVSSDEYLNYAQKNRGEWELKGEQLVAEFLTRYDEKYGMSDESNGESRGSQE